MYWNFVTIDGVIKNQGDLNPTHKGQMAQYIQLQSYLRLKRLRERRLNCYGQ
jgi:hypothetical protein